MKKYRRGLSITATRCKAGEIDLDQPTISQDFGTLEALVRIVQDNNAAGLQMLHGGLTTSSPTVPCPVDDDDVETLWMFLNLPYIAVNIRLLHQYHLAI